MHAHSAFITLEHGKDDMLDEHLSANSVASVTLARLGHEYISEDD